MKNLIFILLLFLSGTVFSQSATTNLTATASDPDGSVASYSWTKTVGSSVTITGANTAIATITFTIAGTYTFQCVVTDNLGATAVATATVVVTAANKPPTVVITPSTITVQLK